MVKLDMFRKYRTSGVEQRFHALFLDMYPKLVCYAVALMTDEDEVKDIVGDVFEQAWKRRETLNGLTDKAWLYAATRNACLNRLKHLQVEHEHIDAVIEATRADMVDGYRQHESLLQRTEEIVRVLPEPTRGILLMHYWQKLTYSQVAEHFGISPETVKKHVCKALSILREGLKEL